MRMWHFRLLGELRRVVKMSLVHCAAGVVYSFLQEEAGQGLFVVRSLMRYSQLEALGQALRPHHIIHINHSLFFVPTSHTRIERKKPYSLQARVHPP